MISNKELELAWNFVNFTNRNIFLTGKAGTGKTTFLKRLKTIAYKRVVVVAPTGVAAINAGGVTIHSFFQLPFGPILPEREGANESKQLNSHKFTKRKIDMIRSLDLLIIDEISMVRADLLDGIDRVLRKYRNRFQPFGGVQLLMIGDLQQLAPVVKNEDWNLLRPYYNSLFFFGSQAFQQANVISIELKHIFRQSDDTFIQILNEIREDKLTRQSLDILNKRYQPNFNPKKEDGYIHLTTHNASADQINQREMEKLSTTEHTFKATVEGIFPEHAFPTAEKLKLKIGAQVMFVKNDSSPEKLFFNGKIGTIESFDEDTILVRCPGDYYPIPVERMLWNNLKYELNERTKELEEKIEGSFLQYPLRLAWSITIHKSQGLTFERAIIDAQAAFAHGQTYVALSRCKSMEGLVLSSPLSTDAVICDREVNGFNSRMADQQPEQKDLEQSQKNYQLALLEELFNLKTFEYQLRQAVKILHENAGVVLGTMPEQLGSISRQCTEEMIPLSAKFMRQVHQLAAQGDDVEHNQELQERIKKASSYYFNKLKAEWQEALQAASFETDNHAVKKDLQSRLQKMNEILHVKLACWDLCQNGLVVEKFLPVRAKALLTAPQQKAEPSKRESNVPSQHPALFRKLQQWRNELAAERDIPAYMILTQKALVGITDDLPGNSTALLKVKGIGKKTVKQYGSAILKLIADYARDSQLKIEVQTQLEPETTKPKQPSHEISYQLFKEGKSIGMIATERDMAVSTIEGHLARHIETGELELSQLVDPEKINKIENYLTEHPDSSLNDVRSAMDNAFSFGEIRMVQAWLKQAQ
ncbi:helix-turn-helix domain-containing protein [Mangrovibacterium marinum]|uniref:HRDC domain-containing protein n=1 Tax=Mangrovibacterium marinum TaxID=1639118 RepID=A0A2T5C3C5_9BACT|nr:helix-turn-helix domain-containing protein [Mangrovibacterium marinum]PTN09254.1 HRDC domain-containing protein [Mangrovibacterium marinum]